MGKKGKKQHVTESADPVLGGGAFVPFLATIAADAEQGNDFSFTAVSTEVDSDGYVVYHYPVRAEYLRFFTKDKLREYDSRDGSIAIGDRVYFREVLGEKAGVGSDSDAHSQECDTYYLEQIDQFNLQLANFLFNALKQNAIYPLNVEKPERMKGVCFADVAILDHDFSELMGINHATTKFLQKQSGNADEGDGRIVVRRLDVDMAQVEIQHDHYGIMCLDGVEPIQKRGEEVLATSSVVFGVELSGDEILIHDPRFKYDIAASIVPRFTEYADLNPLGVCKPEDCRKNVDEDGITQSIEISDFRKNVFKALGGDFSAALNVVADKRFDEFTDEQCDEFARITSIIPKSEEEADSIIKFQSKNALSRSWLSLRGKAPNISSEHAVGMLKLQPKNMAVAKYFLASKRRRKNLSREQLQTIYANKSPAARKVLMANSRSLAMNLAVEHEARQAAKDPAIRKLCGLKSSHAEVIASLPKLAAVVAATPGPSRQPLTKVERNERADALGKGVEGRPDAHSVGVGVPSGVGADQKDKSTVQEEGIIAPEVLVLGQ